ncbi:MAG TPA: selenocysteine-specific translation elongation factor, partial [Gemmatimonadaceae bacterium]
MIIGTAGHIDHGKTALVRALTGVDTDRLPEERRRGITIDLGFAPLALEGVGTVGIVDVPGHEAFVRTMVAGATGIDIALLVIAADEGVMPQTREHLAVLGLLGVTRAVVALTKRDLVDDEWLALAAEDVRETLAATALRESPVIAVSARTGEGIPALRAALASAASALPSRDTGDLARLPVDRAFTVRGTGTVVTGTLWSGALHRDDPLHLHPGDRVVRVRGLQQHGAAVDVALAGARVAVAIGGADLAELSRGAVLLGGDGWAASPLLRAEVRLHAADVRITPRTRVQLHLGTSEVPARLVARGEIPRDGSPVAVRIALDEPLVARAGDRFVLRAPAPLGTIGGGVVTDPQPPRRARPWPLGAS